MNPDVFAAINPAIRELSQAWSTGKKSLCLTIENAERKTRWVQVVDNGLNIGLDKGENPEEVKRLLALRNITTMSDEAVVGKFYFSKMNVVLDNQLVEALCDILSRSSVKNADALNVSFEEL